MAGRGFGKTLTGAHWIDTLAREQAYRLAVVGRTAGDVRDVMVEGPTGVLAINPDVVYEPSKRRLTWPNGATATTFTADKPDMLRGPQHHFVWCDELATWRYGETWDNLMLGLRLGDRPRALVTTTPRPISIVRDLVDRDGQDVVVVRGTTYENLDNLAPTFQDEILRRYEGTRLGRQELEAELLEDVPGALWSRAELEGLRPKRLPNMTRVVVSVDPAVTAAAGSDETGIVVCAMGEDDKGYVLEDLSGRYTPDEWGRIVANAYRIHEANGIIAEVNNGGDLVEKNIRSVDDSLPVTQVRAARGKYTRAEPVAAMYEQKRIYHAGTFPELEDQMCTWVPGDASPDRVDALVWGMTELMVEGLPAMVLG